MAGSATGAFNGWLSTRGWILRYRWFLCLHTNPPALAPAHSMLQRARGWFLGHALPLRNLHHPCRGVRPLIAHTVSFDVFLYKFSCGETSAIPSGRARSTDHTSFGTLTASWYWRLEGMNRVDVWSIIWNKWYLRVIHTWYY